jgi:MoxR-like ATPase
MIDSIISEASRIILDKEREIRLALACLFARGHLLIEDIPGIGKTTLARTLAALLGLDFQRVQCTNDLLPGDILGVSVFDPKSGKFTFHPGPIFSQVVLVDEINRATPKTQSGLLEAMAEGQVSLDRESHLLPAPFFVIATQNPLEHAGTYPLPDSQLDRFLMRIRLGYPSREAELQLLSGQDRSDLLENVRALTNSDGVREIQDKVPAVHVSEAIYTYVQDILDFTRQDGRFSTGLSPRAGLALLRAAQSWAHLEQRSYVLPEDVQAVLPWVAPHRLPLKETPDAGSREHTVARLLLDIPVP